MSQDTFIDNAKVMAKGQITIPKDIRKILGVSTGDRVTFVVDGNSVRLVNSALYAMEVFQKEVQNKIAEERIPTDEEILDLVKELRRKDSD